jgi:predicted DNA-binding antitoxin AbrB/MazE fold protein
LQELLTSSADHIRGELMVIEAKYEDGVFRPLREVKLKEGTVVEIHVNREDTPRRIQSVRELGFAGMWANRADIQDGLSYVNTLRAGGI